MRRRVLQFNPKIFININFKNLIINCFAFTFPSSIKINTSLLLNSQYEFRSLWIRYSTYFLYYLSTQYTCWRN